MKLITRKRSEQALSTLALRAFDVPADAVGPAADALGAGNSAAAADLPRSAVGTVLVVPEVEKIDTRAAAEGPIRLAGDQALALRRALAEVRAAHEREAAAESARAAALLRFVDVGGINRRPVNFGNGDYVGRIRDGAVSQITNAEQRTAQLDPLLDPLALELERLAGLVGESPVRPLRLRRFTRTSGLANRPEVRLEVPEGFKILGGGARVNSPNNLLVASHPDGDRAWVARSRDHDTRREGSPQFPGPATLTVTVIALEDPGNDYEVRIVESTGAEAQHPSATVAVEAGFVMTGGGARANFTGAGSLLTGSYPGDHRTWVAASKDHFIKDVATVTAFAIGLRSRRGDLLRTTFRSHTSVIANAPLVKVELPPGFALVGGGARDNWRVAGNLLTASAPGEGDSWFATGQELASFDATSVTVHAIGLADAVLDTPIVAPTLRLRRFRSQGNFDALPDHELTVPEGFKILSGGATINRDSSLEYLLVSSHPKDLRTWRALARSTRPEGGAFITIEVIALDDPDDAFDVRIFEGQRTAAVEPGFAMTGGGALTEDPGEIYLRASGPADASTWAMTTTGHRFENPGVDKAFAIGLRARNGAPLSTTLVSISSADVPRPESNAVLPEGQTLVGGGARLEPRELGDVHFGLRASIPQESVWHVAAAPAEAVELGGVITSFAIGVTDAVLEP